MQCFSVSFAWLIPGPPKVQCLILIPKMRAAHGALYSVNEDGKLILKRLDKNRVRVWPF